MSEIGRDVLVIRVRPEADYRGFVSVTIAQLRGAGGPRRIVKGGRPPGGPLIGAIVQVFPGSARRNEANICAPSLLHPCETDCNEHKENPARYYPLSPPARKIKRSAILSCHNKPPAII